MWQFRSVCVWGRWGRVREELGASIHCIIKTYVACVQSKQINKVGVYASNIIFPFLSYLQYALNSEQRTAIE